LHLLPSRANDTIMTNRLQFTLVALPNIFAVCRLAGSAAVPSWAMAGDFFSVTRTADELSIVCLQESVPDYVRSEKGWRCLRIAGSIPFSVAGVVATLTAPLAEAGVSVFVVSTFDTDYLLTKEKDWAKALDILRKQGHTGI
jgi:hypothetical protein